MAFSVEFLIPDKLSKTGRAVLTELRNSAPRLGLSYTVTEQYRGSSDLLVLWGVGAPAHNDARVRHISSGRRAILWDMGYFGRAKVTGHCRVSIDHDHPQQWLPLTRPDPSRWERHGITLRNEYNRNGHIVLVGIGGKSRLQHSCSGWEAKKLNELRSRFPGKRILFRPKPNSPPPRVQCESDCVSPIEKVISGASLVVCRHSNVAVDAIIAGVPFEAEDGAATWLTQMDETSRLDFLSRLAWWQWRPDEAQRAWKFLLEILN